MKRNQVFRGKYLSAADLPENMDLLATIKNLEMVQLSPDDDGPKPVLSFEDDVKPLVLNNTNWSRIEEWHGDDSDFWGGKQIRIYHDPTVEFGGRRVGGLRVRWPDDPMVKGWKPGEPMEAKPSAADLDESEIPF